MLPILFRYLAREILVATAAVLLALLGLFIFVDFLNELRGVGAETFSAKSVGLLVLFSIPQYIHLALPIAALIATLFVIARLSDHSELAVMRTSGLSLFNLAAIVASVGLLIGLATHVVGEYVLPLSQEAAKMTKLKGVNKIIGREFRSGFWLRDRERFVNIKALQLSGVLENVNSYQFDSTNRLTEILIAGRGVPSDKGWVLEDVQRTRFQGTEQVSVEKIASMPWAVNFNQNLLQSLQTVPEDMSITQLASYIGHLERNNQQTRRYEVALLTKVAYPIAAIVMMLLALPFAIGSNRKGGFGGRIIIGIMLGLSFHLLSRLFAYSGQINNWPAWVSALTPTLVFVAFALASLRWVERR